MKNSILIIGSGLMGTGIAQVAAENGYTVFLNDLSNEIIDNSIATICKRWESKVSKGKLTKEQANIFANRLSGKLDYSKVASEVELVIEAVYEDYETKRTVFNNISNLVSDNVIIASNTSSISITKLASAVAHPERFIGMHFFSPVPVMKLLEIIPGLLTSQKTIDKTFDYGKKWAKVPVIAKDSAGFIVNRLLDPMLNSAIKMLDEGISSIEGIDNAMKFGCGHPVGPLELSDMIGLDILYAVMQVLYTQTGDQNNKPAELLEKMVKSGLLGQKAGKGFYIYNSDGTKNANTIITAEGKK